MGNIAIDGPAGAGKSTVAKRLAEKLGYVYVDTGAMYRALTLKAIRKKHDLRDEEQLVELAQRTTIELTPGSPQGVYLDGESVTEAIRTPEVSNQVSLVASHPGVRKILVELQKNMAQNSHVVMDGRDIGTRVLPDAPHKFFLDAALAIRAQRRQKELLDRGFTIDASNLEQELAQRDRLDRSRVTSPLVKADDAVHVDTSELTPEEVVEKIFTMVQKKE